MPRDPKPSGQRRRRNLDAPKVTKLQAGGAADSVAAGEIPVAFRQPEPPAGLGEFAVSAWAAWWASPMAAVWLPADLPALVRLARLTNVAALGDATAAVLGEIRQLEDRFGLSPLARRRLAWELEQAHPAEAPATVVEDEGRWLRAL